MRKLTEQEFQNKIKEIHGDKYKTLECYVDSRTKISVKCNVCGHIWKSITLTKSSEIGCPECGKEKARLINKHPNTVYSYRFNVDLNNMYTNY